VPRSRHGPQVIVESCVYCGKKITPKRRSATSGTAGAFFCSDRCTKDQTKALGVDLTPETLEVLARGKPIEIMIFFGLKAGSAIWEAYRRRAREREAERAREEDTAHEDPGSSARARRPSRDDELAALLKILELEPGATLADCESAYRRLAKVRHPDAGGTTEAMAQLNMTIARLRELLP